MFESADKFSRRLRNPGLGGWNSVGEANAPMGATPKDETMTIQTFAARIATTTAALTCLLAASPAFAGDTLVSTAAR